VIDYVKTWAEKTEIPAKTLLAWIGIARSKYYQWKRRYGRVNEHNALLPRDHWLADWEKQAIVRFHFEHPLEGYRRLTYLMMDADIVAVSPASVYRVLQQGGLLSRWNRKPSAKGGGFTQPVGPHEHWHIDVAYVNICGTFYYLCSVLDGFSRYIVHWEIRESMTETDVEVILHGSSPTTAPSSSPRTSRRSSGWRG
jgi:transposase InsO family protein